MKKKTEYPFEECETCTCLDNCKHVEIAVDGLGTPWPPPECPKPIDILRDLHKRKHGDRYGLSADFSEVH